MTLRPAYFIVTARHGRETPAILYDDPPRPKMPGLVYAVRLDTLPNAAAIMTTELAALYAVYGRLRDRGKLPPRWEPPRPKSPKSPQSPQSPKNDG